MITVAVATVAITITITVATHNDDRSLVTHLLVTHYDYRSLVTDTVPTDNDDDVSIVILTHPIAPTVVTICESGCRTRQSQQNAACSQKGQPAQNPVFHSIISLTAMIGR